MAFASGILLVVTSLNNRVAFASAVAFDGTADNFTLSFDGVTYDSPAAGQSTWRYTLSWDGTPAQLSHFVISGCFSGIVFASDGASFGQDGNGHGHDAGFTGIKWESILQGPEGTAAFEPVEFVLSGSYPASGAVQGHVQAGGGAVHDGHASLPGPDCAATITPTPAPTCTPTTTPSATPTATTSPTSTPVNTATPTQTPTQTPTLTPSPTAVPPTPTETPFTLESTGSHAHTPTPIARATWAAPSPPATNTAQPLAVIPVVAQRCGTAATAETCPSPPQAVVRLPAAGSGPCEASEQDGPPSDTGRVLIILGAALGAAVLLRRDH